MKKIFYSNITKFLAMALCSLIAFAIVFEGLGTITKVLGVYGFEDNFYDSRVAYDVISETSDIMSMYVNHKRTFSQTQKALENSKAMYYLRLDDTVLANTNEEYFKDATDVFKFECVNGQIYSQNKYNFPCNVEIEEKSDFAIYVGLSPEFYESSSLIWNQAKILATKTINDIIILGVGFLVLLGYLIWVCGRKKDDDKVYTITYDRVYSEINLGLILILPLIPIFIINVVANGEVFQTLFIPVASTLSGIGVFLMVFFIISMVRNIKNKTFLDRSLVKKVFMVGLRLLKKICKIAYNILKKIVFIIGKTYGYAKNQIKTIAKHKMSLLACFVILVYTICVVVFRNPLFIIVLTVGMCFFVAKRLISFDKIKDGIFKIKNGNIDYKITNLSFGTAQAVGEAVNSIGDGLANSLNEQIKSERMKSELITNVSHDLKTPLTSIINYAQLLQEMELTPQEANDYVKIVFQKSQRLKNLTSDLFDISKIQSGNEKINFEKIDIALLLQQSIGELSESIGNSGLDFQVSYPKEEVFVTADGKKISRVFENLIVNIVNYSLKGTRVYISVAQKPKCVQIEMKNISAYEMNFDDKNITERFVRGEDSRTGEGSGLGLAIAKSYIEACKGTFKISTDGDLFKVIITI